MTESTKTGQLLSIGALARAVGIPVETLRTWERRYGVPSAERTDSGHRRYSMATLAHLRLVRAAIQGGHRASTALGASEPELLALLDHQTQLETVPATDGHGSHPPRSHERPDDPAAREAVARWLELIRRFDGRSLDRELRTTLAAMGALRFLKVRIAPLIDELGERWSLSQLGIRHEHFASERLHEFMGRHWQPLSDAATGPIAVCATTSGERHTLGLHMAAFTLALNNVRVVFLGADLPAPEIAQAVHQHAARAAVLSAAKGADRQRLEEECVALHTALGHDACIVAGGGGFEPAPAGVLGIYDLDELDQWARKFSLGFSPN
jgi:DNA-binding transcriptional MerR regulator/methanogenic corrinoid protein MtbC1